MKTNKVMSFMMALLLSATLYSCGSDNETSGESSTTTNYTNTYTGTPTTDTNLSDIENFQRNVNEGRFKAPESTYSKFDYVERVLSTSTSFTADYYCNIPFICDSRELSSVSSSNIMTRSINLTTGVIIREAEDTGFSNNSTTLKTELAAKIQAARDRSNSYDVFFKRVRINAFIMKPGDNYEYVIDLDKPLVANPVYRKNLGTGEVYDFLNEYHF